MRYFLEFFLYVFTYINAFTQSTYVPDYNFEQFLINNGFDNILDDSVLTYNLNYTWNGIPITNMNMANLSISDLTFIEDCNNQRTRMDYYQVHHTRAKSRTWCDPNGGAYKVPSWTSFIYFTMQGLVRLEESTVINDLESILIHQEMCLISALKQ